MVQSTRHSSIGVMVGHKKNGHGKGENENSDGQVTKKVNHTIYVSHNN